MPCGCETVCTCYLIASDTVAVAGSGTSGDQWIPTVIADPNGGLQTGVNGVGILIDPASTLPWSLGPDGLLLDCCPIAVLDSDTIDFDVVGGAVTGDVIPDPAGGLENTASGVAVKVDATSTADVTIGGAGLKVDVPASAVTSAVLEPGDYKYRASNTSSDPLWLLCDGTSVATATYPDLFAEIGYTFGGAGASFNLPDFRGRGPIHPGSHLDVNALGDSDGLAEASRTPFHSHAGPSHQHGPGTLSGSTAAVAAAAALAPGDGSRHRVDGVDTDAASGHVHSQNVNDGVIGGAAPAGNTPDLVSTDHKHGIPALALTVTGGATASAGTGATSLTPTPYLVAGYWFIRA